MNISVINWLAVFVAALSFIGLGAVWYGLLFRNAWLKAVNLPSQQISKGYLIKVIASSFIMALVVSTGMAVLLKSYWASSEKDMAAGASLGMLCGIFFLFPSISMSYILAKRAISLVLIDAFFYLLAYTCIGVIVGAWR